MSRTISRFAVAVVFAAAVVLPVTLAAAADGALPEKGGDGPAGCPAIGDTCSDGTINAGVSPDTGQTLFVTPEDAPGTLKWEAAMKYADGLDANGHADWRLPSIAELDVLYQNRDKGALKGTFDESGFNFVGWYWSSTESPIGPPDGAWVMRFSDGYPGGEHWKGDDNAVRPVRSEPRP